MIITNQTLENLEQDSELKKKYAGAGSWGQNKLVFLPVVTLIMSAFGLYFFYDLAKTDSSYTTWAIGCGIVLLLSLIAIAVIQRNAKKQVLANISSVPVCVAKKIYGNDQTGVYYCIYTKGNKRHDISFIDTIADKIYNIDNEPDPQIKKAITNLFSVKFADTNSAAVPLPITFTEGEQVYQKQFSTANLKTEDGKFAVLAFNQTSVPVIKQ